MGSIDNDGIYASFYERGDAIHGVVGNANSCGHSQTTKVIFARARVLFYFDDVAVGYEADEAVVGIDYWEFFDAVLLENNLSGGEIGAFARCNDLFGGHDFADRTLEVFFKAKIAVGQDTF